MRDNAPPLNRAAVPTGSRAVLGFGLFAAWLYYPLSPLLLVRETPRYIHDVQCPWVLPWSLLAIIALVTESASRPARRVALPALLFLMLAITGGVVNGLSVTRILETVSIVVVPLAVAVAWRQTSSRQADADIVVTCLAALWIANIAALRLSSYPGGLCGNQNWLAAVLVALVPWTIQAVHRAFDTAESPLRQSQIIIRNWLCVGIVAITAWELWSTRCKASLIAIPVGAAVIITGRARRMYCVLLVAATVVAAIVIATVGRDAAGRWFASDLRIPLWQSTCRMTLASPVVGHGAGEFRRVIAEYKLPAVKERLVAAGNTAHPHNELLNVAALQGIPAALAWLIIVVAGCLNGGKCTFTRLGACSACTLFLHGIFDKSMSTSPSSVLFLLMLGLCLPTVERPVASQEARFIRFARPIAAGAAIVALAIPVGEAFHLSTAYSLDIRGSHLALLQAQRSSRSPRAARDHLRDAYQSACEAERTGVDPAAAGALAGMVASEFLDRPRAGAEHFRTTMFHEPRFGFVNHLYARARMREAITSGTSPGLQPSREIVHHLETEVRNHPYTCYLLEELIRVLALSGDPESALAWNAGLEALYVERCRLDARVDAADLAERLRQWRDGRPRSADVLIDGVDRTPFENLDMLQLPQSLSRCRRLVNNLNWTSQDDWFWREVRSVRMEFEATRTVGQLLERLSTIRLESQSSRPFSWPSEVLKRGRATDFEIVCCASFAGRLLGYSCLIVRGGGTRIVVIRGHGELSVWNAADGSTMAIPDDSGHTSLRRILRDRFEVPDNIELKFEAFCYPHEFREVHHALSCVDASDRPDDEFRVCPAAMVARLRLDFGRNLSVRYAQEPFDRLEHELRGRSRTDGPRAPVTPNHQPDSGPGHLPADVERE